MREIKKLLPCLKTIRPCVALYLLDGMEAGWCGATMKACATRAACKGAANDQTDQTAIKINLLQGGSDQ